MARPVSLHAQDRLNFALCWAAEVAEYLQTADNLTDADEARLEVWQNRVISQGIVMELDVNEILEILEYDVAKQLKDRAVTKAQLETDLNNN